MTWKNYFLETFKEGDRFSFDGKVIFISGQATCKIIVSNNLIHCKLKFTKINLHSRVPFDGKESFKVGNFYTLKYDTATLNFKSEGGSFMENFIAALDTPKTKGRYHEWILN